ELVREARAGQVPFSVHFIPFSKAVQNGLYRRVCLVKGIAWTAEGEAQWAAPIRGAYGVREAAMRQELDCIPAEMEGAALTRVQIEAAMAPAGAIPIVRWVLPDTFRDLDEQTRRAMTRDWCAEHLAPVLDRLDRDRPHY